MATPTLCPKDAHAETSALQLIMNPGSAVGDTRFFGIANQIVTIENFFSDFRYVYPCPV